MTARLHTAVRLRTAFAVAVAVVQLLLQLLLLLLQPLQLPWLLLLFPLAVDKKLLEQFPAVAVRSNQSSARSVSLASGPSDISPLFYK